jgi:hypothetical protein
MKIKKVRFNAKIMLEIFTRLDALYRNKMGIYKYSVLPENRHPAPSLNFLFFTAMLMRWGVNSEPVYKAALALHKHYPKMFEPCIVKNWQTAEIIKAFENVSKIMHNGNSRGKHKAGVLGLHIEEHAENWVYNAKILDEQWGGEAKNIFWGVTDFEEAWRRVNRKFNKEAGFKGMAMKIFSLFMQWGKGKGYLKDIPCPIPVDYHSMRVLWATDAISLREYTKPFDPKEKYPKQVAGKMAIRLYDRQTDQVALFTHKLMKKHGFTHEVISPTIWLLSAILCAKNLQNSTRGGKGNKKKDTEIRFFEAKDLKKHPELWPPKYKDPCINCPVEDLCKWAIPSTMYYHMSWGILMRLDRRISYNKHGKVPRFDFKNWPKIPFTSKIHMLKEELPKILTSDEARSAIKQLQLFPTA